MKRNNYLLGILLTFSLYSCENDNITGEKVNEQIQNEYIQMIKQLGFDEASAIDMGDYYIVEEDIRFFKKDLPEYATLTRQARTDFLIRKDKQDNILIKIDNSIPTSGKNNWRNAIVEAINEWNSLNSYLYMSLTTGSNYDILIQSDYGSLNGNTIAVAGFPYANGNPFDSVLINFDFNSNQTMTEGQKVYNIIHELGHCVGLRHTNWKGRRESDGITITGTPNSSDNPDPNSFMNGGTALNSWNGFSYYDRLAIQTLYPSFRVSISGPESFCYTGTYSVDILPGYSLSWSWSSGIAPVGSTVGNQITFQKVENSAPWIRATFTSPLGKTFVGERTIIYAGAPDFSDNKTNIGAFMVNRTDINIEQDILETMWTIYSSNSSNGMSFYSDKNWMSSNIVFNGGWTQSGYYNVGVRGRNRCGWGYETRKILYVSRY